MKKFIVLGLFAMGTVTFATAKVESKSVNSETTFSTEDDGCYTRVKRVFNMAGELTSTLKTRYCS